MIDHPTQDRLHAFGLGQLSGADSDDIERHLASCPTCVEQIGETPDDAVVRLVRELMPRETPASQRVDTRSRYSSLRFHARGGLGEVWRGRDEALGRDVAVKRHISNPHDQPERRRRFLREAAITGRLEHPGIAPIYGLGESDSGDPCYVMRFVEGQTLADAIRDYHAGGQSPRVLRQLLARFVTLCATVAYAHGRGVIHRDIKPSNVVVGEFGETILLDWGLAHSREWSLDPSVTESDTVANQNTERNTDRNANLTATGAVLGTPGFMAPEQAAGMAPEPAADQFSLGATLHSIVTGVSPLQRSAIGPATLRAIAVKAMSVNPVERYASVLDLSADIDRWLADEPVTAMPDPLAVRVRRMVRRHQTASVALVVLLITGMIAMVIGTLLVDRERRMALSKEAESAAVLQFFDRHILSAARPKGRTGGLGRDVKLIEAIDAAIPAVETNFKDQPLIEARIRETLGQSYLYLSEPNRAETQFRLARTLYETHRGLDHLDTLNCVSKLAVSLRTLAKFDESLALETQILKRRRATLGPSHPDTLRSLHNLANLHADLGHDADALKLDQELFEIRKLTLGPDHPDTLKSMASLVVSLAAVHRDDDALNLAEQLVPRLQAVHGPENPETLIGLNNLANRYHDVKRFDDAMRVRTDVRDRHLAIHGPDHALTLIAESNLARSFGSKKQYEEALKRHRHVLDRRQVTLPPDHPDTLLSQFNVVATLYDMGRVTEAIPLIDDLVRRATGPAVNPAILPTILDLRARHFSAKGDVAGCRESASMWESLNKTGPDHFRLAARLRSLACAVGTAADDADHAFQWLERERESHGLDRVALEADRDFDILRSRPEWLAKWNALFTK
ncbi:MAG: tetratricopeptide repeat protein [Gemmataceae bacterium]